MTTTTIAADAPADSPARPLTRIQSIDVVRGVVMILMAIDHVRVYAGVPPGGPTPGVFFTRWITHFVAPAFIFLAGTSAFLHGRGLNSASALSRFLLTRGVWLVLLELTFIRVAWTFNFDFGTYLMAGVIWAIGICMMLLAGLIRLPLKAIAAFGIVTVFAHNLIGAVAGDSLYGFWLAKILYFGGDISLGGPTLVVLYSVIPWIGVMAAGYAFGALMQLPAERRRTLCLRIGLVAVALFIGLRFLDVYGDYNSWRGGDVPALLRFLNTSKYPASLLFLLMTLGPTIAAVGLLERAHGRVADVLATFGRVPLFYYLLHIPAIHGAAMLVSVLRFGHVDPWLFANHPMWPPEVPAGYRWSLPLLYVVTALVVALLYIPCRRFARLKRERRDLTWLSYL